MESIAEREVLKNINANCNSPVSVYAKIINNMISVQCDIFDHDGNKLFSNKIFKEKENHIKIANTLAQEILNDLGQEKINKLNELDDFNYAP